MSGAVLCFAGFGGFGLFVMCSGWWLLGVVVASFWIGLVVLVGVVWVVCGFGFSCRFPGYLGLGCLWRRCGVFGLFACEVSVFRGVGAVTVVDLPLCLVCGCW